MLRRYFPSYVHAGKKSTDWVPLSFQSFLRQHEPGNSKAAFSIFVTTLCIAPMISPVVSAKIPSFVAEFLINGIIFCHKCVISSILVRWMFGTHRVM